MDNVGGMSSFLSVYWPMSPIRACFLWHSGKSIFFSARPRRTHINFLFFFPRLMSNLNITVNTDLIIKSQDFQWFHGRYRPDHNVCLQQLPDGKPHHYTLAYIRHNCLFFVIMKHIHVINLKCMSDPIKLITNFHGCQAGDLIYLLGQKQKKRQLEFMQN